MERNSAKLAIRRGRKRLKRYGNGSGGGGSGGITVSVTLPEEIVMEEILPRLPVKSLVRFKSVTKLWFSTISKNPKFAHLHYKFSSLLRRQFLVMDHVGNFAEYHLLPFRESSNMRDLVKLRTVYDAGVSEIVGSCNGIVCIYNRINSWDNAPRLGMESFSFHVWNPATHEIRIIKGPPDVCIALAYGFGYVSAIDDYVIVASFSGGRLLSEFRGLYVFSLRVGEWKRVVGRSKYKERSWYCNEVKGNLAKEKLARKLTRQGVLVDETLYWLHERQSKKYHVVGFDLAAGVLKEYTDMSWNDHGYFGVELFRLQGCLALYANKGRGAADFWRVKNVNDSRSWQMLFSANNTFFSLMTLSETGKCLLKHSEQFQLVDMCKESLECIKRRGVCGSMTAVDYVESLISPWFDDEVHELEDRIDIRGEYEEEQKDDDECVYSDAILLYDFFHATYK